MEINAEMNKVFGEEMAKLFSATITEEEMKQKASDAWFQLNHTTSNYYGRDKSQFEQIVNQQLATKITSKINELLGTEEYQVKLREEAEQIITEIREATHKKIVDTVSNSLSGNCNFGGNMIRDCVNQMFMEAKQRGY